MNLTVSNYYYYYYYYYYYDSKRLQPQFFRNSHYLSKPVWTYPVVRTFLKEHITD